MAGWIRKAWQTTALAVLLASALLAPAQGADAAELGSRDGCYQYGQIGSGWDRWYYVRDFQDQYLGHVFAHDHYDWWGARYVHQDWSMYCDG